MKEGIFSRNIARSPKNLNLILKYYPNHIYTPFLLCIIVTETISKSFPSRSISLPLYVSTDRYGCSAAPYLTCSSAAILSIFSVSLSSLSARQKPILRTILHHAHPFYLIQTIKVLFTPRLKWLRNQISTVRRNWEGNVRLPARIRPSGWGSNLDLNGQQRSVKYLHRKSLFPLTEHLHNVSHYSSYGTSSHRKSLFHLYDFRLLPILTFRVHELSAGLSDLLCSH